MHVLWQYRAEWPHETEMLLPEILPVLSENAGAFSEVGFLNFYKSTVGNACISFPPVDTPTFMGREVWHFC